MINTEMINTEIVKNKVRFGKMETFTSVCKSHSLGSYRTNVIQTCMQTSVYYVQYSRL